jgi:LemA protein
VTKIRLNAQNSNNTNDSISINNELNKKLKHFLLAVEAYPELKANANFIEIQKMLVQIENDIANARNYYNGAVRQYNNYISMFPNIILAKIMRKEEKCFFNIDEIQRNNVNL